MDVSDPTGPFPWWGAAADDDLEAARKRAVAWMDDPYPRVWAKARSIEVEPLLRLMRQSIDDYGVEDWPTPPEMETWLRGLLQGCATMIRPDELPMNVAPSPN